MASIEGAVTDAFDGILAAAKGVARFDDASLGRAERNCRRVLADLVRGIGPVPEERVAGAVDEEFRDHQALALPTLGEGLTSPQTAALLAALETFLADPESSHLIASLVRSYAVLAVCQMDPQGKTYSRSYFANRLVALDTDVVLELLCVELPEQKGVRPFEPGLGACSRADSCASSSPKVAPERPVPWCPSRPIVWRADAEAATR
jgi:hypothetical protein